jgi:3-oxoacyl-[acyl-carrier protein] reductase
MRLAGKVALVTGAQQGIGKAISLAYGREGACVAVNYLDNRPKAEAVAGEIQKLGQKAIAVQGDVSRKTDVDMLMEAAFSLGDIDVLVNNAGIFPRSNFLEMSEKEWDKVLTVNLKGTFLCTQTFARKIVERGGGGVIINIASIAAFRSSPRGAHYVSSKAGIIGFTRATALELAPHHMRVNAIAPGITDTAQPRYGMSEEELQHAARQVPLGRLAVAQDIANLAVFLASEEANHITGQTIHVNGGRFLY